MNSFCSVHSRPKDGFTMLPLCIHLALFSFIEVAASGGATWSVGARVLLRCLLPHLSHGRALAGTRSSGSNIFFFWVLKYFYFTRVWSWSCAIASSVIPTLLRKSRVKRCGVSWTTPYSTVSASPAPSQICTYGRCDFPGYGFILSNRSLTPRGRFVTHQRSRALSRRQMVLSRK